MIVGRVSDPGESLEPLFLGQILGHYLAHLLKLVEAGIEQAKTPYCVGEVVVQRLVAPESLERQFALNEGAEEGMALAVPSHLTALSEETYAAKAISATIFVQGAVSLPSVDRTSGRGSRKSGWLSGLSTRPTRSRT